MAENFAARLAATQVATNALLDKLITDAPSPGERPRPPRLVAAMRHAALGPGKRLRPFLLIESARLFGRSGAGVLRAAAAIECVHCYSLVHDDLPAMDDDDMRRGRPTVHKAFDEAIAILAGDALLTLAFAILADRATNPDAGVRATLIGGLAAAAGVGGMVGGQALDLAAETRTFDEPEVRTMQAMKTGALFRFACEAGAIIAGASPGNQKHVARFGEALGLVFQIADDLIDATGKTATAGKATGKDAGRGKATLVTIHGVTGAQALLARTTEEAVRLLAPFGKAADGLAAAARFAGNRDR
jgi:farnesyl diphosphate synthase